MSYFINASPYIPNLRSGVNGQFKTVKISRKLLNLILNKILYTQEIDVALFQVGYDF
jgi:hypothetical protein